jgi:hypothetical protein
MASFAILIREELHDFPFLLGWASWLPILTGSVSTSIAVQVKVYPPASKKVILAIAFEIYL